MQKNEPIKITWIDIEEDASWLNNTEIAKKPDTIVDSLGYFSHEDEDFYYISSSVMRECENRNRTAIPKGVVKRIQKIMFYGEIK